MPGGYKNINGSDGNTFSSTNQPAKNGRKKKIYTILKEKGYSADDIKTAFGELAFYDITELRQVYEDETKPVITRIVANQFFQALKSADWGKIKDLLEYIIGKPNSLRLEGEIDIDGGDAKRKLIEKLLARAGQSGDREGDK